jgi:hypothetical protein
MGELCLGHAQLNADSAVCFGCVAVLTHARVLSWGVQNDNNIVVITVILLQCVYIVITCGSRWSFWERIRSFPPLQKRFPLDRKGSDVVLLARDREAGYSWVRAERAPAVTASPFLV